jgi:putative oxidoreductase
MKLKTIRRQRLQSGFTVAVRLSLGCMFLYSSLPKIRQPYDFLSSAYNYELVGPKLGLLVAMVLPWAELFVGICLIGGIFVNGALLVSISMGAIFSFAVASALQRGLNISCGCFSKSSTEQIGYITLIRSLVIMLISVVAYLSVVFLQPRKEKLFT